MKQTTAIPACPRCHGRLHLTSDRYGRYLSCLMCGYVHELINGKPLGIPSNTTEAA
jgi:hypothetical protein